jgi:hypothetical protein
MIENQSRTRQRRRSRSEADRLASEYEASGLTREEFCRQQDLALKTLARYITRYRKQRSKGNGPQRWVEAKVVGQDGCGAELAVLLSGGRRIEVKPGFDADTLRLLVASLERM